MNNTKTSPKRPTSGLLCNELNSEFTTQLVWSAAEAAQRTDSNLPCFAGRALCDNNGAKLPSNVIYDLIGDQQVDGVPVMSNFMGTYVSQEDVL